MISTVEDLLVYGRALGSGEGLLPPEQQAERLNSFLRAYHHLMLKTATVSASLTITGG